MQKRLSKFKRTPEALSDKPVTDRGLLIIETVAKFRFLASSDIIRLVGGNEDVTYRHLQQLYHQDLLSRIALPRHGGHGEFIYFLDNISGLRQLAQRSKLNDSAFDWKEIRANRDKYRNSERNGADSSLFIEHELMISRFRADLEIECGKSAGRTILCKWMQGSRTWNSLKDGQRSLPHRPDALFSLGFPNAAEGQEHSSFFYEADRSTLSPGRLRDKLKAHLLFLLQRKHLEYGISGIRAVLIHTINESRAQELWKVVAPLTALTPLAEHLFWLASSEELSSGGIFSPHFSTLSDRAKRSILD